MLFIDRNTAAYSDLYGIEPIAQINLSLTTK